MPRPDRSAVEQQQQRTLARLEQVKHHFTAQTGSGRFHHRVAIVTGVGSLKGIGRATVRLLAREGAKAIYILDFDGSTLDAFAKELEQKHAGLKVTALTGDAADASLVESTCERARKEHGRLDFFFANAGITGRNFSLEQLEDEAVMEIMRVNVLSCFLAVKHASTVMKQNPPEAAGGSIVLTASVAGLRSGAGPQDYSASKAAVINLANTSAQILSGTGIRVNAICPGLIETGMTTFTFDRARERGTLGKVGQLNPLRRFGIPEEIAQAALFLASDDASYVNGIALPVDGGLSSSLPTAPGHFM